MISFYGGFSTSFCHSLRQPYPYPLRRATEIHWCDVPGLCNAAKHFPEAANLPLPRASNGVIQRGKLENPPLWMMFPCTSDFFQPCLMITTGIFQLSRFYDFFRLTLGGVVWHRLVWEYHKGDEEMINRCKSEWSWHVLANCKVGPPIGLQRIMGHIGILKQQYLGSIADIDWYRSFMIAKLFCLTRWILWLMVCLYIYLLPQTK